MCNSAKNLIIQILIEDANNLQYSILYTRVLLYDIIFSTLNDADICRAL